MVAMECLSASNDDESRQTKGRLWKERSEAGLASPILDKRLSRTAARRDKSAYRWIAATNGEPRESKSGAASQPCLSTCRIGLEAKLLVRHGADPIAALLTSAICLAMTIALAFAIALAISMTIIRKLTVTDCYVFRLLLRLL